MQDMIASASALGPRHRRAVHLGLRPAALATDPGGDVTKDFARVPLFVDVPPHHVAGHFVVVAVRDLLLDVGEEFFDPRVLLAGPSFSASLIFGLAYLASRAAASGSILGCSS